MKKNNDYQVSSGNVFADLELSNPEERLAKAELARQINNLIKQKRLTQMAAAKLLGIDQPKISALSTGKLSGFSLERLFRFLTILDQDVTVQIRPKRRAKSKGAFIIESSKIKKSRVIKRPDTSSNTISIQAQKKNK